MVKHSEPCPPRARAVRRWTPSAIRDLVDDLEGAYGRAEFGRDYDAMEELVSCILSQHTSDSNSYPAFERLRRAFPSWGQVVEAGPEGIAPFIRSAGLANQKSKSIVACLRSIHEKTGAYDIEFLRGFPMQEAVEWLVALPGVGRKTAAIVLCFGFGMDAIPVDTHVYRVSWRLGLIPESLSAAKAHDALLEIVPSAIAYRFHMALIHHGRAVCKAPLPKCEDCAVAACCPWLQQGGPNARRMELLASRASRKPPGSAAESNR